MAGARHHAPRDPIILRLAPSPDVLRGLPGPPAGQVRACDQGAARRGLHELERPRLLLQIRAHRREVRADRGPGPGQIPGREEARRNAGVQGLAGVGGRGRQRPLLRRGPGAGPEGAPGRGALLQGGHAEHERVAVPAPESARRGGLRHLRLPRGPWRARRARSSFTCSRRAGIRPGLGRPCSRWTTSSPCTSPSPHRPRSSRPCASSATGTKQPWSFRTPQRWSPASAGGLARPTWNRPGCPRWSSSSGLVRASGVRPAWARWQEPAQAPAQQALQALQPRDQALKPRGGPHCQPFLLRVILLVVVQENRKGNAGPAGIYDVAVYICQFEAQGAQGNGAVQFHEMALVGSCLHNVANAFVDNHFADDILTQRPLDVGSRCEGAASEQQLRVRIHGDEGKDLQGAVDEGGAEQMADAQGAAGRGARRVAPGAREEASDLVVVEDAAVAVVGDSYLVGRFHIGGRGVVAADPGGQPRPRVGSDRQHRPVEGLQGLVDPVEVLAPVRAEEGVFTLGTKRLQHDIFLAH